jgi:hypothetical protein
MLELLPEGTGVYACFFPPFCFVFAQFPVSLLAKFIASLLTPLDDMHH